MSFDWSSYVIFGIMTYDDNLYDVKQVVKKCKCSNTVQKGIKFCPHCGKSLLVEKKVPIDGYDDINNMFNGYDVIHVGSPEDTTVLIGICLSKIGSYDSPLVTPVKSQDTKAFAKEIKKFQKAMNNTPFVSFKMQLWHAENISY